MRPLPFFCLLIFSLFACTNTSDKQKPKKIIKIKMVSFSEENPFAVTFPQHTKYTIISYLNVSCPPCLAEIKKWNEFNAKNNHDNFQIKLVCYSDDDFQYFKFLCREKSIDKFPYPFLLDTAKEFVVLNKIFKKPEVDKTVLIDADQKIILYGNPLNNETTLKTYLETLK